MLLFAGCTYGLERGTERHGRQYRQNPEENRVDFGTLGDKELCCGSPPEKTGNLAEYERLATANIKRFNELGVKTVAHALRRLLRHHAR